MLLLSLLCLVNAITNLEGHVVVDKILATIESGQFSYYTLNKPGRVVITLIPKEGDPDLYIGENGIEPDYSIGNHSYQSTSCGIDRVVVPVIAIRPVVIGVYGHPSHEKSIYELQVKIDQDATETDSELLLDDEDMRTDFVETDAYRGASNFHESPLLNFLSTVMSIIIDVLL
ncbi:UPF0669 protein C6orf120 homolog [Galendromus occidentalis]|uniref:UPF0669 protein C6orf120 homolog n=1 Tax=Galendromus occidentalis TaxID=34638 RepID=A0AAJ6VVZ7_9ACAR|nr:UPF0669 protein C6orf120 homolog [Galendromus occidentalis]